jgi:hypothetical protein
MGIVLSEKDFRPIRGYPFQRWGERTGRPFCDIRPLSGDAARRLWQTVQRVNHAEWDGSLPSELFPQQAHMNLRDHAQEWDEQSVRRWLLEHEPRREREVLVSYGPHWAVSVDWGTFCDHWLVFLWVPACVWPTSEGWVLRYADEQLVFGRAGEEW